MSGRFMLAAKLIGVAIGSGAVGLGATGLDVQRGQSSLAAPPVATKPAAKKPNAPKPVAAKPAASATPPGRRHALLVGCTAYPTLDVQQLEGPANDVVLMRSLLEGRFQFPPAQIVTLAESEPDVRKPTRANIEQNFARLAKTVRPGDQVVILMSGHGTQQPDAEPADPNDPEPDGLDEVFLPRDAKPFDRQTHTTPNAIVDDELGLWVRRIRDAGALVWIIVDSCHSGTITRGSDDAVVRRVDPEQIIPAEELAKARARGPRTRGGAAMPDAEPAIGGDLSGIVALYAAQPEQSTIELPLPPESDSPQRYGLLTFVLNKVLAESIAPITYRELAQRIETQYAQWGKVMPTPVIEGRDRDREVLGLTVWPNRSSILLSVVGDSMQINAGALHGLTKDSVLRVASSAGGKAAPVGHVRVSLLGPVTSQVVPCAFGKLKEVKQLPNRSPCEVVYADAGLRKLQVYIDARPAQLAERLKKELGALSQRSPLIAQVANRRGADWVLHAEEGQVYLEPGSGFDPRDPGSAIRFGPAPLDAELGGWLGEHLRRIARAQNLLRLVQTGDVKPGEKKVVDVEVQIVRTPAGGSAAPLDPRAPAAALHAGDQLEVKVHNRGADPADVTLLFIDSGFGIQCVYPVSGTATDNRVYAGETPLAFTAAINDKTVGMEHLVMIAVPVAEGGGQPVDFGVLEQPTLAATRSGESPAPSLSSPFGQLLETAMYGHGTTRGRETSQLDKQQISLFSWRVEPTPGAVEAAAP